MCPLHVLVRGRGWALLPVCLEGYTDVPQGLFKKKKKNFFVLKGSQKANTLRHLASDDVHQCFVWN